MGSGGTFLFRHVSLCLLLGFGLFVFQYGRGAEKEMARPKFEVEVEVLEELRQIEWQPLVQRICHVHRDMTATNPFKTQTVYEFLGIPHDGERRQLDGVVTDALAQRLSSDYRSTRQRQQQPGREGDDEGGSMTQVDQLVLRAADIVMGEETRRLYDDAVMPLMLSSDKKDRDKGMCALCSRYWLET